MVFITGWTRVLALATQVSYGLCQIRWTLVCNAHISRSVHFRNVHFGITKGSQLLDMIIRKASVRKTFVFC